MLASRLSVDACVRKQLEEVLGVEVRPDLLAATTKRLLHLDVRGRVF